MGEVSREFYLLTGASFAFFLASQTIQPIFPLYIVKKGTSTLELGLIVSLLSFVAIISKVPLGALSERIGRWPVILAALFGQSMIFLLYSFIPSPYWFYPIRIAHALILSAFVPTVLAIVSDLAPPKKRGDIIGRFLTSFGMATMLGPLFCSFLTEHLGYENLFRVTSIVPFFGLVPLFVGRKRFRWRNGAKIPEKEHLGVLESLKEIVSSKNILILSYLRVAFSFTNAFFVTLFAVYASDDLLLTSSSIALLFGAKGIMNMVSRVPSGKLADKIGTQQPLLAAFGILTAAYFLISETESIPLLFVAMGAYGAAHGMRAVIEWASLRENVPSRISNLATAYLSTVFNVGDALGSVVCGALSLVLTFRDIFKLASFIVASGVVAALLIRPAEKECESCLTAD